MTFTDAFRSRGKRSQTGRRSSARNCAIAVSPLPFSRISLKIARSGLPEIVPVTEFRDTIGVALTNIIGGADVASELRRATEAFKPVLAKANEA